ncbi:hypothetical protein [Nitrosopumilus sp. K4]|nr:hypothetical protein [Nitrosopumilus sp. K4]
MAELEISSFLIWSVITAVIMGVTGISYRLYLRRKNNEISSS